MQNIAGLPFDNTRYNLTHITTDLTGDGVGDKCDGCCSCVDGAVICYTRREPDGRIGKNVSSKEAFLAKCSAAAYLPEDATSLGAVCRSNLTIDRCC